MTRHAALFVVFLALWMTGGVASASQTSGTIATGGNEGYAWSSASGWVNFGVVPGAITITDGGVTGYAWSANHGWINMNPDNGGVRVAANGSLSGKAWGEQLGWIDFAGVSIDGNGRFIGQAMGDGVGTLVFDCDNCSVVTDYRPSLSRSVTGGGGGGSGGPLGDAAPLASSTPASVSEVRSPPLVQNSAGTQDGVAGEFRIDDAATDARGLSASRERAEELSLGDTLTDTRPTQLFDIRLLIDDPSIARIIDLVARVTFESFGSEPTPVEISYAVADAAGQVLWRGSETVTVETELIAVKRFATIVDMPDLPDGAYTLHVHTRYNDTVEDDFSAPFTIASQQTGGLVGWSLAGLAGLLAVLVITRFIVVRRRQTPSAIGLERLVS